MSKLIQITVVIIALMLVASSIILVTNMVSKEETTQTYEIRDALGRRITVGSNITRVVSLSPSLTEIMFELGLDHLLIAVDEQSLRETPYLNASSKLIERNITDVGGYWWSNVNLEKILSLSPDIVLVDKGAHAPLREFFESYNITAVYFNGGAARSLEEVYLDILLIGRIFNKQVEAEEVVSQIKQKFQMYENAGSRFENITVLVVVGIDQAIWVAGPETFIGDVLSKLGVNNACRSGTWVGASLEMIAQWNPTVIIIASDNIAPDIIAASGLEKLSSSIFVIEDKLMLNMINRPSSSLKHLPQMLISLLEHPNEAQNSSDSPLSLSVSGELIEFPNRLIPHEDMGNSYSATSTLFLL
ncbi:MAG: ABC transporter substrate-binding protein [Thermosphaera sp.]